jgi:hypothetical protein
MSESKSPRTATNGLFSLPPELFLLIADNLAPEDLTTLIACSRTLTQTYVPLLAGRNLYWMGLLVGAVKMGFHELIHSLLTHGADPNVHLSTTTALHWAALGEAVVATQLLLEFGADPNLADKSLRLPLDTAVHKNNIELARALLEAGADCNSAGEYGLLPLHLAIHKDSAEMIELLADAGASLDALGGEDEETPLQLASLLGSTEAVRMLLHKGADLDIGTGAPALVLAADGGNLEIVKMLVEAGASRDLAALTYDASREGEAALVKVLLESGKEEVRICASIALLHMTAEEENQEMTETFQVLLDAGIVVNKTTLEIETRRLGVSGVSPRKVTDITEMLRRYDADLAVPSTQ